MILDDILEKRRADVRRAREERPLDEVARAARAAPAPRDFGAAVRRHDGESSPRLISEVKRASPSKGPLAPNLDPALLAAEYASAGASALSVLTEERHFRGSLADLAAAKSASGLPTLRKDFVVDEYQIYEARAAGADAILLIVAALDDSEMDEFVRLSAALGLTALVEVHDEAETGRALAFGGQVIGINNRDLKTFRVDLATTGRLRRLVPLDRVVIAESGIRDRDDVCRLSDWGIDAMLVGESLVTAKSATSKIHELLGRC